jgi:hypothetical protein
MTKQDIPCFDWGTYELTLHGSNQKEHVYFDHSEFSLIHLRGGKPGKKAWFHGTWNFHSASQGIL